MAEWIASLDPVQIGGIVGAIVTVLTGGSVGFTVWWRRRPFKVTWELVEGRVVSTAPKRTSTPPPPGPAFDIEWDDDPDAVVVSMEDRDGKRQG